jgi:hypothetical protein
MRDCLVLLRKKKWAWLSRGVASLSEQHNLTHKAHIPVIFPLFPHMAGKGRRERAKRPWSLSLPALADCARR